MVKTDHSNSFQGSPRTCASAELGVGRRVSFEPCRKAIRPGKRHSPALWLICTTGTSQGNLLLKVMQKKKSKEAYFGAILHVEMAPGTPQKTPSHGGKSHLGPQRVSVCYQQDTEHKKLYITWEACNMPYASGCSQTTPDGVMDTSPD